MTVVVDFNEAMMAREEGRPVPCTVHLPEPTAGDIEDALTDVVLAALRVGEMGGGSPAPVSAASVAADAVPWWNRPPMNRRDGLRLHARRCGEWLLQDGGREAMDRAWERVNAEHGGRAAAFVDKAWSGLAGWRA